ncbi:AraC family transcriptional regulator [Pseudomonas schmalbachii]|uniref:Helix-turn-helix transcriptional regulator n=1 Tax=Pseudomonas schmalbachii TaxID=2816993 RepID=A0ABS3TP38_9PSED|nr:helix-turn-helix transcriptional regulator [Pseudomonas schmalbachii]MBO3274455.1 helix-turn-helix transcriptional regulator [Pseudomonas schmalbachii]
MARATPPDLNASDAPLRGLARSYPRGLYIEPHEHEWGQVLYAMSGVMWLETPQEALLVPPHRAVWLPPGVLHGIRVVSELQMRNIYLRPSLAQSLEERVQVFEVGALLRELILRLVEQEQNPEAEYYRALSDLAVLELRRARRSLPRVPLPDASDRRLLNLCHAVMAAPSQDIPFEQHAADAGASVRTLARLFQRSLGMGFAAWRRQVQLATAVAALTEGTPVSVIAHSLGYQAGSFSEMFRRELGVSPSAYLTAETL